MIVSVTDNTELNKSIVKAENIKNNDYTLGSWSTLQTALEQAKSIRDGIKTTQGDIQSAISNLQKAIDALSQNINISVSSVKINGSMTIRLKQSVILEAVIAPADATNKAVTWSSSNSNVAKVDAKGKVTGIKEGIVTLTVKAKDGSGKSDSVTIKIAKDVTKVRTPASNVYLKTKKSMTLPVVVDYKEYKGKTTKTGADLT